MTRMLAGAILMGIAAPVLGGLLGELFDEPVVRLNTSGHTDLVLDIAWMPDGRGVVTGSTDKTVRVRDMAAGGATTVLRWAIGSGQIGAVMCVAVSPDSRLLAAAGTWPGEGESHLALWDLRSGELVRTMRGHRSMGVTDLVFSTSGHLLASGAFDGCARIWRVSDGTCLQELDHEAVVSAVAFSPDGANLVTGCWDGSVHIWGIGGGRRLDAHSGPVQWVGYSPTGTYLASAAAAQDGTNGTVCVWSPSVPSLVTTIAAGRNVRAVSFTPDGQLLVPSITGGGFEVFSLPDGHADRSLEAAGLALESLVQNSLSSLGLPIAWGPDRQRIAVPVAGKGVHILRVQDGHLERSWIEVGGMFGVGWSEDGSRVAFGQRLPAAEGSGQPPGNLTRWFDPVALAMGAVEPGETYVCNTYEWESSKLVTDAQLRGLQLQRGERFIRIADVSKGIIPATFTPEGDCIASIDRLLLRYNRLGTVMTRYAGGEGQTLDLAVSPDARYLAATGTDKTLRIWNVSTGELLLCLFVERASATGDADAERAMLGSRWIMWTPQGYYAASAGADELAGWHINKGIEHAADFVPLGQYASSMYRPDVIKLVLEHGSVAEAAQASEEATGGERVITVGPIETLKHEPPRVTVQRPTDGQQVTQPAIELQAMVLSPTDDPIRKISVLVNGRPTSPQDAGPVQAGETGQIAVKRTVQLTEGENVLAVAAETEWARSKLAEVRVIYDAATARIPNCYVLAVGVSDYRHPDINDLKYARADAEAIVKAFEHSGAGRLFAEVHSKLFVDEQATKANVIHGLNWLVEHATHRDLAVAFVAGHGELDNNGFYYFIPHDFTAERGLKKTLDITGLPWSSIGQRLANLPAKALLLLDTCHSAAAASGMAALSHWSSGALREMLREYESMDVGVLVLAAATARERSWEDYVAPVWGGHGAFTKALLEGMAGKADAFDRDGLIDIYELTAYTNQRVPQLLTLLEEEFARRNLKLEQPPRQHVVLNNPHSLPAFVVSRP